MVLQMILRTNYEGQDQVRGQTIFPSRLPSYPPLLHGNKMLLVQVSLDSSYHDDDNDEEDVFTGCCYPYKHIVALAESHFRHTSSTRTTTTAFDLFYITTQQRDNHDHDDNNKENSNNSSNNVTWIHQLVLVPTVTNCRDWERWTFLGECQTCMLRLHIAKYLKQFLLQSGLLLPPIQKKNGCVDYPPYHHSHQQPTTTRRRHRRRRDHWHMEAFIDRIFIPTHPPHWLADHPNIYQCSRAHHARLSKRAAFSDISNTATSLSSSTSQRYHHQQQQDDVNGQELKDRSVSVPITR
jgi:hypothetical protein